MGLPSERAQFGVMVIPINMCDSEIERAVANFARSPNGGLIPTSSAVALRHRNLIVALAVRHKLPNWPC